MENSNWWSPEGRVWTKEHYPNMLNWDERTRTEMRVLQNLIGSEPKRIVDVPCGFGRHSLALAEAGHHVVGVDLNHDFLVAAQEQAKQTELQGTIGFVGGDMRSVGLKPESFDVALNLFTSFGYFDSPEDDEQFFQGIADLLTPGGKFILDLPNPDGKLASFQPDFESDYGSDLHVVHHAQYDPETQMINESRRYEFADGHAETAEMHVRLYTPDQIVALGKRVGLQFSNLLDKQGNEYNSSTGRYWIELVKE
jgi:SAM-dependent methyltransferase